MDKDCMIVTDNNTLAIISTKIFDGMSAIDEFRAGVTACLRSWSALRTAVESGWGGGEKQSQAKAEDLRQNIFNLLDGQKFPPSSDATDLADNLAIYMEGRI
jgi:pre-rRNA-processing protein TSR2